MGFRNDIEKAAKFCEEHLERINNELKINHASFAKQPGALASVAGFVKVCDTLVPF